MGVPDTGSDLQIPITKEFLEKILKKEVHDFKVSAGSKPGDNFTSMLIALEVVLAEEKDKPLHLLFKTFPSHPSRQKMLEHGNIFQKELQVYDHWLTALVNFQREVIGNEEILKPATPELVVGAAVDFTGDPSTWAGLDPMLSNFILMVDVRKTYGFEMANKLKSLGYHHVKVIMEELAKLHALGYAYKVHHKLTTVKSKFPCIDDPFFADPAQKPILETMFRGNMNTIFESCNDFLEARTEVGESMKELRNPAVIVGYLQAFLDPLGMSEERVEGFMRVNPSKLKGPPMKEQWIAPSHGDCWTNNILFKKDENGNVSEAVLVDLQIAREACIMTDLAYFIYTSTDTDFRKQYLAEMLERYHQKFVHFCDVLKVKPFQGFSLGNFQRKFHRTKLFGLSYAMMTLPLILQKQETAVNLDNLELEATEEGVDEVVEMFSARGRDDDDQNMLRERCTKLFEELYEEGVV